MSEAAAVLATMRAAAKYGSYITLVGHECRAVLDELDRLRKMHEAVRERLKALEEQRGEEHAIARFIEEGCPHG